MDFFVVYGLTIISVIITVFAQIFVEGSYSKYKKVRNEKGITGMEAARYVLDNNGLSDVKVEMVSGHLSDHYDPKDKAVRLSSDNYGGDSVASVSVACHECGHALQDKDGYLFMRIRHSLVPVVNFSEPFETQKEFIAQAFSAVEKLYTLSIKLDLAGIYNL